ncbi:ORF6N domain-containing protein [Polaromonas eurypsychrophila]
MGWCQFNRTGIETKRFNEQIKRNSKRFPPDFMLLLIEEV